MNCKKCNAPLMKGDVFCNNCGAKVEEEKKNTTSKTKPTEGSNAGWGILGFFVPIVGLILFFVWLKEQKSKAKAVGLGALIGGIIMVVGLVIFFLSGFGLLSLFGPKVEETNITIKKYEDWAKELANDTNTEYESISLGHTNEKYRYVVDYGVYSLFTSDPKIHRINVLDKNNKKLFQLEINTKNDETEYCKIRLNDGKEFYDSSGDCVLGYSMLYYNDNNIVVVGNDWDNDEIHFTDLKNNESFLVFSTRDSENDGLYMLDFDLDDEDNLKFEVYLDGMDKKNLSNGKSTITSGVEHNVFSSLEELEKELKDSNLDDFIVEKNLTYTKQGGRYSSAPNIETKTIIQLFKEKCGTTTTERTEDCVKVVRKEGNKYVIPEDASLSDIKCKTVTYNFDDKFSYKIVNGDRTEYYVNGTKIDDYLALGYGTYIAGNTLVTSSMRQTTVNGGMSVTLINKDGEIYNFKSNPEGQGRDINLLDTEGKRDDDFSVNDNGELTVVATKFNKLIDDDYLGDYAQTDITCAKSVDEVAQAYGTTADGDFATEYTYKLNDKGLFDFNYSSKKTATTIRERYNQLCN